jgi:hypothetical protein
LYAGQADAANGDKEDAMTSRTSTRFTPMLFSRQRQLLQLLEAIGGRSGMLDFQKLPEDLTAKHL